jgi:hypothetical protein
MPAVPQTVIVTIHGQESKGKKMRGLSERLKAEAFAKNCIFINIRYTKLLTVVNTLPWVRSMTAKYIASRLDTIDSDYPNSRVIVIAHSNGTRATSIAMDMRYIATKRWPKFTIDRLILLGCPMKRNYDWSNHPHTKVMNYISTNDKVVFMARFYGMGAAGRYGFKKNPANLTQIRVKWGHSGFMKQYDIIRDQIQNILRWGL